MLLLLLFLTNTNYINKYLIILCLVIMAVIALYFPPIVALYIIDIYIYIVRTKFLLATPIKVKKIPFVSMDITTEGIEEETIDVKSLLVDYGKKFDN